LPAGEFGAVTVIQRANSDLRLDPHLHAVVLDGVFVAGAGDGQPVFHALPRISDVAVADLLQVVRARLLRYLVRHHVVEDDEGQTRFLADDLAERDPALAQLAAAAVAGLPLAGPELRRKPLTVVLPASDGPKVVHPLCVEDAGFSLHAHTRAGAEDDVGRNNLLGYVLRPPIAQEHVTFTEEGLVAIQLKKPFRDDTVSVEMDPLSLASRLAAAVHPPKFHTVRFGGILAPHAQWRPFVIPPPTPETATPPPTEAASHSQPMAKPKKPRPATHRCGYVPWHVLLRQLGIDVETLGPARPAPAPRGFAAPVACTRATVLAEPRPAPPLRRAARRGPSVGAPKTVEATPFAARRRTGPPLP
jgi:hypothetical protein